MGFGTKLQARVLMDFKLKLTPMQWAPYPIDKLKFFQETVSPPSPVLF